MTKASKKKVSSKVFHSIDDIKGTTFTGVKSEDTKILDAIMSFIYRQDTSLKDRIAAAKYMAVYSGSDPESINAEYVESLMKEYAAAASVYYLFDKGKEMRMRNHEKAKSSKVWFNKNGNGYEHQTFNFATLTELTKKIQKNLSDKAKKANKINIEYALAILKSIEKRSTFKVRILSKDKLSNGAVAVDFAVEGFVMMNDFSSPFIKIISNPDKTFTLIVGA